MRATWRSLCAAGLMMALALSGAGQRLVRADEQEKVSVPPVPLKVTVTISRFEGEKKTANLPFVFWVNTGDQANVQMGSDVPVPQTTMTPKEGGTTTTPVTAVTYRTLGTNISCTASALGDGLYRLSLSVNDSQVFRQNTNSLGPVFQNFRSTNTVLLRDGGTAQFAVATDKTTGEVIKLDVVLNLVK